MGAPDDATRFRGEADLKGRMDRAQIPIAPTISLLPLGRLAIHSIDQIRLALANLRNLYFRGIPSESPAILGPSDLALPKRSIQHPIHDTSVPDSGYASAEEDEDEDDEKDVATTEFGSDEDSDTDTEFDLLRIDPLERAFAIKWVTGFIARSDTWISACDSDHESEERSEILEEAISLLSAFTGSEDEEDVALTRTFTFPLSSGFSNFEASTLTEMIQVELNDAPLSKDDHTSVGLQSWGSSILFAERICLQPSSFSLSPSSGDKPIRILELGAGTGMLSIIAAKILHSSKAEIIATDYHPDVLENLFKNVKTNFPTVSSSQSRPEPVVVKPLDWERPSYDAPFDRSFDVILAADVIYHPSHARWIKSCIERLLKRPVSDSNTTIAGGVFWLIIPVRTTGRHEGMDRTVDALFPDSSSPSLKSVKGDQVDGQKLAVIHREEVGRQSSIGRADEGAYKLFKIGWVN